MYYLLTSLELVGGALRCGQRRTANEDWQERAGSGLIVASSNTDTKAQLSLLLHS